MAVPAARVEEAGAKGRARRYSPHSNRKHRWPLASNVSRPAMLPGATPRLAEPDPVLRQWPQTERPTYRAIQCGPESLTDAELISVLLRTGTGGQSAIDTACRLIQECGSLLAAVTKASDLPGEQAARLTASLELARRVL